MNRKHGQGKRRLQCCDNQICSATVHCTPTAVFGYHTISPATQDSTGRTGGM